MKTIPFILGLLLCSLIVGKLDAAAVGKGAVGSGGRGRAGKELHSTFYSALLDTFFFD